MTVPTRLKHSGRVYYICTVFTQTAKRTDHMPTGAKILFYGS